MSTRAAVTHARALAILAGAGIVNESNAQRIYDDMSERLESPAQGYFYLSDVHEYGADTIEFLMTGAE
jgi:hypothetical protein